MEKTWLRDGVLVAAAMVIGWWAHGERVVQAAGGEDVYQFMSNNLNNALTVYDPGSRVIYVYEGASALGSSHINCAYMFHLSRPGNPIDRENCKVEGLR